LKEVDDHKIASVIVTDDRSKIKFVDKDGYQDDVYVPNAVELYDKLVEKDVDVVYNVDNNRVLLQAVNMLLQFGMLFLIGGFFLQLLFARGGQSGPLSFGKSKALLHETKNVKVKFDDVAGLDEAKIELQEVIDFLKSPEKYSVVGGKIPKGCLLVGPPGTGKTLLAKAVAGEANVPFYSCSASEFIELFVGVGASRVRDLFKNAASTAPCIIFIDEIDAIGKARGSQSMMGGNDEREQTINQLLTEMDGFKENSGVIVIAATNRVDVLDQALLRPGRFDRQITVDLPDYQGRIAILKVHTKNKPLEEGVALESVAKVTTGYSGADLANLANEAAILTARRNKSKIGMKEFDDALEKVVLGFEKRPIASEYKRKLVAYHEAGHTLVALKVGTYDTVRKVTIIPRGKAGGVTLFEPDADRIESGLYSKEYLLNQISVALGGRIAEEIVFGKENVTTGASSDIEKVQQVARMMVSMYGFSDDIGPIAWKPVSKFETQYSEMMLARIDNEVRSIVSECYDKAFNIITRNRAYLDKIANKLIEVETLTGDDLAELVPQTI
jgi:cell division protease FtsH